MRSSSRPGTGPLADQASYTAIRTLTARRKSVDAAQLQAAANLRRGAAYLVGRRPFAPGAQDPTMALIPTASMNSTRLEIDDRLDAGSEQAAYGVPRRDTAAIQSRLPEGRHKMLQSASTWVSITGIPPCCTRGSGYCSTGVGPAGWRFCCRCVAGDGRPGEAFGRRGQAPSRGADRRLLRLPSWTRMPLGPRR